MDKLHGKSTQGLESSHVSSRGASPSRPVAASTPLNLTVHGSTNGKKTSESMSNPKSNRRKSPLPLKRGDRDKATPPLLFPSNTVPFSAALPATPSSTHSLALSTADILHPNSSSVTLLGASSESTLSSAVAKSAEDQSTLLDDELDQTSAIASDDVAAVSIDDPDGVSNSLNLLPGTADYERVRLAIEQIHSKISKTRDLIREEQTARDENVNEYLRLAAQADKQQQSRLKAVFEKKNTKSAQQMIHLQRKLESYQRKLRVLEAQGTAGLQGQSAPKQMLRGVGLGLKTVMSKPREFAHLIRNKFGSADNINNMNRNGENAPVHSATDELYTAMPTSTGGLSAGNSNSLPGHSSQVGTSHSATLPTASQGSGGGKYTSEEGSECGSSVTSESIPGGLHMSPRHATGSTGLGLSLEPFFQELQERREEVERLREEMETVKQNLQQEVSFLSSALQEERFRVERLEEQINDLTELHQNEVENLKQNIADMEEKVQYQSEERLRDIQDLLESCHTRISKVEHQAQHQQHVSLEGIENSNARAVLVKLINMALTLLQLVLVVVSTIANIISPFLKTRLRVLTTCFLAFILAFIIKQWPDLLDLGSHLIQHYKAELT